MTRVILVRGAPAVGKTTSVLELLKILKERKVRCAYICEDNFRKHMQTIYKSSDKRVHMNSELLIQDVILRLMDMDDYDLIFIEGLFRYREVIDAYETFFRSRKISMLMLQLSLDINEMIKRDITLRDKKSPDIVEVKRDIEAYTPDYATIIQSHGPASDTVEQMLSIISKN